MDSNKQAFERVPDSFLERLTDLLSIPMLGCDVLAPKAGASSGEWLETNCRVLPPSIAGVDGEVILGFCLFCAYLGQGKACPLVGMSRRTFPLSSCGCSAAFRSHCFWQT